MGAALLALMSCAEEPVEKELPVVGPMKVIDREVGGIWKTDTVFTQIRPFEFVNHNGDTITEQSVTGKVYVADFFFTSCPTICPKMKQQMLRVHQRFGDRADLLLLSHSIDPKRDSVGRLAEFASKLDVTDQHQWHFMTGERDSIYSMAKHYMVAAQEDELAPGGYAHSGAFLLVDKNRQIRGIYDGTLPEEVDELMADIEQLLNENIATP